MLISLCRPSCLVGAVSSERLRAAEPCEKPHDSPGHQHTWRTARARRARPSPGLNITWGQLALPFSRPQRKRRRNMRAINLIRASQTGCQSLPVMVGEGWGVLEVGIVLHHPLPCTHTHTRRRARTHSPLTLPSVCSLKKLDWSRCAGVDSRWADLLHPDSWEKIAERPPPHHHHQHHHRRSPTCLGQCNGL